MPIEDELTFFVSACGKKSAAVFLHLFAYRIVFAGFFARAPFTKDCSQNLN